ncbi:serine hydrolase domain-containing protein [Nocardia sp. NPDC051463]|uniref:serine hydrolase domain-containing protein n=1 Tax=Nocardia sp. NPDC051463 TaxID=3154845 RepID=UPI00344A1612
MCDGDWILCGAAAVATGCPAIDDMRHRVCSITKTFTADAVARRVDGGEIGLETSISRYLPRPVPGERGAPITIRMLINRSGGLAEYLPDAYSPSLPSPTRRMPHRRGRNDNGELVGG